MMQTDFIKAISEMLAAVTTELLNSLQAVQYHGMGGEQLAFKGASVLDILFLSHSNRYSTTVLPTKTRSKLSESFVNLATSTEAALQQLRFLSSYQSLFVRLSEDIQAISATDELRLVTEDDIGKKLYSSYVSYLEFNPQATTYAN